jgi:hypothetical protein
MLAPDARRAVWRGRPETAITGTDGGPSAMGQQVVGTAGETSIKIVVKSPGSNEIITAYPVP